jgi:hypothetical protein
MGNTSNIRHDTRHDTRYGNGGLPGAALLVRFHERQMLARDWPVLADSPVRSGVWTWIGANHRYNGLLWREEDRARRLDVPPEDIAAGKRLIDRYHRKRNDAVEAIDEALLAALHGAVPQPGARLSSETAGAMIDRLSILALKIHHMRMQAQRTDAGPEHVQACSGKLERLLAQRRDLASCLDTLLAEARAGRAYFKVYRQCRMFDDPAPAPCLDAEPPRRRMSTDGSAAR